MKIKKFLWRRCLVPICLGSLVIVSSLLGLWENMELASYDTWFNLRGKEFPGDKVAIIAMDENSIEKLGPLPWPRETHARLLDQLRQASVVGFDVIFDAPTDVRTDTSLAAAVKQHGRVVLGSMFTFDRQADGEVLQQLKMPLPELLDGACGIGFVNMPAEKGSMVRRVTVVDTNMFGRPFPSFSLAGTMVDEGITPDDLFLENGLLTAGKFKAPLNNSHQVLIDFWGPGGTFPTYSYIDVLEGRMDSGFWKDKILLVGSVTPTGREDIYENPFTKGNMILSGALPSPGVEIHASAIKTYLTGRYFQRASQQINLAFLILIWLVTLSAGRLKPWTGLLFVFLTAFASMALVYFSWLKMHYWLNIAAPLIMVAVTYTGVTVENFVRVELERRRTKALFGRYVSPAVVDGLLKQTEKIELGGVKQEVTILFSDIRGFTAFSEGKPPEAIVARLNEYFTAMTGVVFRHGGTLDKYLGDGLMAIFGAPVPYADHAERAVEAAIEMLERLEELNKSWQERGEVTLGIGVGINSGSVVVGNIGSLERMEYTVIGDEVNLASRLEGMNKEYKTRVIISERTVRYFNAGRISVSQQLKELGKVQVRGLVEPVRIYTIDNLSLT